MLVDFYQTIQRNIPEEIHFQIFLYSTQDGSINMCLYFRLRVTIHFKLQTIPETYALHSLVAEEYSNLEHTAKPLSG